MSNYYLLASLVLAACATKPAPHVPVPPPAPEPLAACEAGKPGKTVLLQITETSKAPDHAELSSFVLYTNGAWSSKGYQTNTSGCLDISKVTEVEHALAPAKWELTHQELRCMAEAMSYTTYSFKGAAVYRDEMCSGELLDGESQQALQTVNAIVRPLFMPS